MTISFDKALGIHQHTVGVRERNAEVISTTLRKQTHLATRQEG